MKKEDIEFLNQLKKDLIEQDKDLNLYDGQAKPRFWGVLEDKFIYRTDGEYGGDPCIVYQESEYSQEEIEDLKESVLEDYPEDVKCEDIKDIHDIEDLFQELNSNTSIGNLFSLVYKCNEPTVSQHTGAFLTKKDCKEYINNFGYNHNNPRTYAMTAFRNFRLAKLLEIIERTDWEKELQNAAN